MSILDDVLRADCEDADCELCIQNRAAFAEVIELREKIAAYETTVPAELARLTQVNFTLASRVDSLTDQVARLEAFVEAVRPFSHKPSIEAALAELDNPKSGTDGG